MSLKIILLKIMSMMKDHTMNKDKAKMEISFMDVKSLYDAAYAEKAQSSVDFIKFNDLMMQAEKMANQYRQQLQVKALTPFTYKRAA